MSEQRESAREFMRANLRAMAAERRTGFINQLPSNALLLQASRMFAECMDIEDPLSYTETELSRLCIIYASENA